MRRTKKKANNHSTRETWHTHTHNANNNFINFSASAERRIEWTFWRFECVRCRLLYILSVHRTVLHLLYQITGYYSGYDGINRNTNETNKQTNERMLRWLGYFDGSVFFFISIQFFLLNITEICFYISIFLFLLVVVFLFLLHLSWSVEISQLVRVCVCFTFVCLFWFVIHALSSFSVKLITKG